MTQTPQTDTAMRRRMLTKLNWALAEIDQGTPTEHLTTRSPNQPGVQVRHDGSLIAWGYGHDGIPVVVSEASFDLVGVAEVAQLAGLSPSTIKSHLQRGTIVPPVPVARSSTLVWRRADIDGWLAHRRHKAS